MDRRTRTERALRKMRTIIAENKRRLDVGNIEEEARTQAGKLSNLALQLVDISKEVGAEAINRLLENVFENELAMKAMQLRVGYVRTKRSHYR